MREKIGKSRFSVFFPMICGSGGSKSRLAKAAGAEPAGQMRHEKVHAVVARSTFWSQNGQNTRGADHFWKLRCRKSARRCGAKHILKSDHFWKLRCRKSARRCGAKHIWKSKCTKHTSSGPLLEVEMSKKCRPLWREAHLEVKMYKALGVRTTFGSSDLEKVHAVVARSTFRSQNVKKTLGGFGPLLGVQMSLRVASLHYTTLQLHYTTLHYTTLHSTTTTTPTTHNYTPLH